MVERAINKEKEFKGYKELMEWAKEELAEGNRIKASKINKIAKKYKPIIK